MVRDAMLDRVTTTQGVHKSISFVREHVFSVGRTIMGIWRSHLKQALDFRSIYIAIVS